MAQREIEMLGKKIFPTNNCANCIIIYVDKFE